MTEAVNDPNEHDQTATTAETPPEPGGPGPDEAPVLDEIDVIGIEADLDGVQTALTRLADGTYWTDEVSGEPIPAEVLAADPLARRA